MSTLVQIESAVADLPERDQRSLLTWLQGRLDAAPQAKPEPEALAIFRKLQAELALTPERAAAWKRSVADARR